MKNERIELCPGPNSGGHGRMCSPEELSEYMRKRYEYINSTFGKNNTKKVKK